MFSNLGFSQILELGVLDTFGTFAAAGAISSNGTSEGDTGTKPGGGEILTPSVWSKGLAGELSLLIEEKIIHNYI